MLSISITYLLQFVGLEIAVVCIFKVSNLCVDNYILAMALEVITWNLYVAVVFRFMSCY